MSKRTKIQIQNVCNKAPTPRAERKVQDGRGSSTESLIVERENRVEKKKEAHSDLITEI